MNASAGGQDEQPSEVNSSTTIGAGTVVRITGAYSCFGVEPELEGVLQELYAVVEERKEKRPEGSYTTYLFNSGLDKILKKVGEEATETIVAAKNEDSGRLVSETSDLVYHLLVMLVERGVSLDEVLAELKKRRK